MARIASSLGHDVELITLQRPAAPGIPVGEFLGRCTCGWLGHEVNRDVLTRAAVAHARQETAA